jgi:hypothetical protein
MNNDYTSMSNPAPAISGTGHIIFNTRGYFGAILGQITVQRVSGLGLNYSTFASNPYMESLGIIVKWASTIVL